MPIAICLVLVPLLIILLYGFVLFDRLVKTEYDQYRLLWAADGNPRGFFWRAERTGLFDIWGALSRTRLTYVWLFRTPPWIQASPLLKRWLNRMRLSILVWNIGVLTCFVLVVKLWR
jgi:hypothetical protein